MRIDGGCHCGFITYEAEADPEKTTVCHCVDCQSLSGSAFRVVAPGITQDQFRMLGGQPTIYLKTAESGAQREQAFCPRCGSSIYSSAPGGGPKVFNLRVGTIRQRDKFIPRAQIWCRSQQQWLGELTSVKRNEKQ